MKNEPGALGVIATIIGAQKANIVNMRLDNRDTGFHTNTIDVEVHDLHHLTRLIAARRQLPVLAPYSSSSNELSLLVTADPPVLVHSGCQQIALQLSSCSNRQLLDDSPQPKPGCAQALAGNDDSLQLGRGLALRAPARVRRSALC